MTPSELLALLLDRSDRTGDAGIVIADDLVEAPDDALRMLKTNGWLMPTGPAVTVWCDGCDESHAEVPTLIRRSDQEPPRAYITCPTVGRVAVDLERLRQWQPDANAIARSVAELLGTTGLAAVSDGRLWALGRVPVAGAEYRAFIGRGRSWADGDGMVAAPTRRYKRSILFVLASHALASGARPIELPLRDYLELDGEDLKFDWRRLEELCADVSATTGDALPTRGLTPIRRVGRPRGRYFGALLDCWFQCSMLQDRFDTVGEAYDAIQRYLAHNPRHDVDLPEPMKWISSWSYAKAQRRRQNDKCCWYGHPEAIPSELTCE